MYEVREAVLRPVIALCTPVLEVAGGCIAITIGVAGKAIDFVSRNDHMERIIANPYALINGGVTVIAGNGWKAIPSLGVVGFVAFKALQYMISPYGK